MSDIDPIKFGQVLARLDAQDEKLDELHRDVRALMETVHTRKGIEKAVWGVMMFGGFLFANLTNWFNWWKGH